MDYKHRLEIAADALASLEKLHAGFMTAVAALARPKVNGGHLAVVDNELVAEVLYVLLSTKHRPIVRDGHLMVVEYAFKAQYAGEDLIIWSMYLEPNGILFADSRTQDQVCGSENMYLSEYVVARLASALLSSPVFAPTK